MKEVMIRAWGEFGRCAVDNINKALCQASVERKNDASVMSSLTHIHSFMTAGVIEKNNRCEVA